MPVHSKAKEAARFVTYETRAFSAAAERLEQLTRPDHQLRTLLTELACIHARVIYEFLYRPVFRDDAIRAKHYFDDEDENQWPADEEEGKRVCPDIGNKEPWDRLNRSVAHLSYCRIGYEEEKDWDITKIAEQLRKAWADFHNRLSRERKDWFIVHKEGRTIEPRVYVPQSELKAHTSITHVSHVSVNWRDSGDTTRY